MNKCQRSGMWQRSVKVGDKFSPQKFIHTFTIYDMHSADSPNKNHMHISERHCNALRILASPWYRDISNQLCSGEALKQTECPFEYRYEMGSNCRYFMATRHFGHCCDCKENNKCRKYCTKQGAIQWQPMNSQSKIAQAHIPRCSFYFINFKR